MAWWVEATRALLLPFLYGLALVFAAVLVALLVSRGLGEILDARRRRLADRYRPIVDALVDPQAPADALSRAAAVPPRHRAAVGALLLAALRPTVGRGLPLVRDGAAALGLTEQWHAGLTDRRWWTRAESARALAFIHAGEHAPAIVTLLDDPHEEVRAAALDALGRLGDEQAIPPLVARLHDEARHQRVRIVEALRLLGPPAAPALIRHASEHPEHTVAVIEVLGATGAANALDALLTWSEAADPAVRAAAVRAVGSIGLDDRSFYYMLRALDDANAGVRAMAARAVGRSGREMAAGYLGARLEDEWLVAAHAAGGLRRLGQAGRTTLQQHASAPGVSGVLARQMLWDLDRQRRRS